MRISDWSSDVCSSDLLVHTLGHEQVTIVAHSLGGNFATRYPGLYPEKVVKFVNIEGLGPPPQIRRELEEKSVGERLRQWIGDKRKASGRSPRKYATRRDAYQRMKEENSFLTDEQARHLTIHGASRNEDGTWSWKFDNYLNVWPVTDTPTDQMIELWRAITRPMLLLWGDRKSTRLNSPH